MTWKNAVPTGYGFNSGQVFAGTSQGPPLQVRESEFTDLTNCIVIELENMYAAANQELTKEFGIPELQSEPVLRLALHLPDARRLCSHLITALASSGDRVAGLMREKMLEAMNEIRLRDQEGE